MLLRGMPAARAAGRSLAMMSAYWAPVNCGVVAAQGSLIGSNRIVLPG